MDEEQKKQLNDAISIIREYCHNNRCEDCILKDCDICGWAIPPCKWPDID